MAFDFSTFTTKLTKSVEHFQQELKTLRTGKATPALLDSVSVEAYGAHMKLNEVANVSAPDATLLVVSPWDKSILESVEKAINAADLNLNPVVDGDLIRIAVPPLTQERREEMVKLLDKKTEETKATLRSLRTDIKKEVESQEGQGGVSEDDIELDLEQMEKQFVTTTSRVDEITAAKKSELMTV